jgi:predicted DNA binding protein/PAS domain-containing protein
MSSWQYPPVLWLFVVASLSSFLIGLCAVWYTLYRERRRRVVMVAAITIPIAVWVGTAAIKVASTDPAMKTLWYRLEFVGHAWLPSLFVVLVLDYVAPERITRRLWSMLLAIPVVTIALAVGTPDGVFITTLLVSAGGGYVAIEQQITPLFGVHILWSVGVTLVMTTVVLWAVVRRQVPRFIGVIFGIAPLIPVVVFTLRALEIYPPGGSGFDVTPAAIGATMVIDMMIIYRHRVFDRVHTGRSQALEAHAAGYLLVHDSGHIVDANTAAAELVGASDREALLADDVRVHFPEAVLSSADRRVVMGDQTVFVERTAIAGVGETSGYALLLTDITELAERERELTQYAALIERLPVGVYRVDMSADPSLRYANPALVKMLGAASLGELQAASIPWVQTPGDEDAGGAATGGAEMVDGGAQANLRSSSLRDETLRCARLDGTQFWGHATDVVVDGDDGRFIEGSMLDVTELKEVELAVVEARDELRRERDSTETLRQLLMETAAVPVIAATIAEQARERVGAAAVWVVDADGETVLAAADGADGPDGGSEDATTGEGVTRRRMIAGVAQSAIDARTPRVETDGGDESTPVTLLAVPATYEGVCYGAIVASEPDADPREPLAELAETVGFVQQREQVRSVLTAPTVLQLAIEVTDPSHPLLAMCTDLGGTRLDTLTVTTTRLAKGESGVASLLVETPDAATATSFAAAEDAVDTVVSTERKEGIDGRALVQVRTTAPTIGETIRTHAGFVTAYTVYGSRLVVEAEFPRRTLAATVLADLREAWPGATLRTKRSRSRDAEEPISVDGLTDRQAEVLAVATKMGFFERPQRATGADVAEVVDVSRTTVMKHLRAAEHELFTTLFGDDES